MGVLARHHGIKNNMSIQHFHTDVRLESAIVITKRRFAIMGYCNMASPYYLDEGPPKYIDYDLDVKQPLMVARW